MTDQQAKELGLSRALPEVAMTIVSTPIRATVHRLRVPPPREYIVHCWKRVSARSRSEAWDRATEELRDMVPSRTFLEDHVSLR